MKWIPHLLKYRVLRPVLSHWIRYDGGGPVSMSYRWLLCLFAEFDSGPQTMRRGLIAMTNSTEAQPLTGARGSEGAASPAVRLPKSQRG